MAQRKTHMAAFNLKEAGRVFLITSLIMTGSGKAWAEESPGGELQDWLEKVGLGDFVQKIDLVPPQELRFRPGYGPGIDDMLVLDPPPAAAQAKDGLILWSDTPLRKEQRRKDFYHELGHLVDPDEGNPALEKLLSQKELFLLREIVSEVKKSQIKEILSRQPPSYLGGQVAWSLANGVGQKHWLTFLEAGSLSAPPGEFALGMEDLENRFPSGSIFGEVIALKKKFQERELTPFLKEYFILEDLGRYLMLVRWEKPELFVDFAPQELEAIDGALQKVGRESFADGFSQSEIDPSVLFPEMAANYAEIKKILRLRQN